MHYNDNNNLGRILKQRRIARLLTLQELAAVSGVSSAHLGCIETGERFPSARILRKIAKPLGLDEAKLFTLAGSLSTPTSSLAERNPSYSSRQLDPHIDRPVAQSVLLSMLFMRMASLSLLSKPPHKHFPSSCPENTIKVAYRDYSLTYNRHDHRTRSAV